MNDLPEDLFTNLVWNALHTRHSHLSVSAGSASRYPADVAPFVAIAEPTTSALHQLHSLLLPKESVWLIAEAFPPIPDLTVETTLQVLQLVLPEEITPPPEPAFDIVPLTCNHAAEMVALTDIAFPGFFRPRTCEMGSYFGIRSGDELIAMGGERLMLNGYSEISGVCTHPAHRGHGYAADLIWHLVRRHRLERVVSWLHVTSTNRNAIDLYLKMGFKTIREITLHRISLTE